MRAGIAAVGDAILAAFPDLLDPTAPSGAAGPVGLDRADLVELMGSPRFAGYAEALGRVGNCAHPIVIRGHSHNVDAATGEVLRSYSSDQERLGLTYLRCGNRRAAVCPSCSRPYAGDMFHLIRAGVVGGKTVPEHVADTRWCSRP